MSNPTPKEIINAHKALADLKYFAEDSLQSDTATIQNLKEAITTVLPPKPRPTMAEVEWDGSKHYLAEAEQEGRRTVIMIKPMKESPQIKCLALYDGDGCIVYPSTETLTPSGKRYVITEVQE